MDELSVVAKPLIYSHFSRGMGDPKYLPVDSWQSISAILREALDNYNDLNATMNLVLFEDAMQHVCRWVRRQSQMTSIRRGGALKKVKKSPTVKPQNRRRVQKYMEFLIIRERPQRNKELMYY